MRLVKRVKRSCRLYAYKLLNVERTTSGEIVLTSPLQHTTYKPGVWEVVNEMVTRNSWQVKLCNPAWIHVYLTPYQCECWMHNHTLYGGYQCQLSLWLVRIKLFKPRIDQLDKSGVKGIKLVKEVPFRGNLNWTEAVCMSKKVGG